MHITPDALAKIAHWQPAQEGFGRDDAQTPARIQAIANHLRESPSGFGCDILEEDGLSNYFVLFAYVVADVPSFALERYVEGLLIYLSACAAVGVVGRSQHCVAPGLSAYSPLEIDDLLAPEHPAGRFEEITFAAIRSGGYELLSAEEVGQPLPSGVAPDEYCLGAKPWDRVFHALFANTH
jgi:hypothetical protein